MQLSLALVALTAATDSQAPVISLNLDGTTGTASAMGARHINYVAKSAASPHALTSPAEHCYAAHVDAVAGSSSGEACAPKQNSFADECEFGTPCQEPIASAYDHHEGDITSSISTVYRLFVKSQPHKNPTKTDKKTPLVITQRGEWVITYDVEDSAGNDAEQVQFALIIIDTEAPTFDNSPMDFSQAKCTSYKKCINKKYISSVADNADVAIELCGGETAGYEWLLQTHLKATDNYDGKLDETDSVMIAKIDTVQQQTSTYTLPHHQSPALTAAVTYTYDISTADFADIFGSNNANNVATETGTITMEDTIIPTINVDTLPAYWECGYAESAIRDTTAKQYSDCYDDHTGVKNIVDVAYSCNPGSGVVTGYYGDSQKQTGDANIAKCLGTQTANLSEGNYGVDSSSIVSVAKNSMAYKVTLTYDVTDKFGNDAVTVTKTVAVKDTLAPTLYITQAEERTAGYGDHFEDAAHSDHPEETDRCIKVDESTNANNDVTQAHCKQTHLDDHTTLIHKNGETGNAYGSEVVIQHSAGYAQDYTFVQELMEEGTGFGCYDICSATTTTVNWMKSCSGAKGGQAEEFNMLKPGTYYLKYVCKDEANLKATACRTFINIDKTKPVITVLAAANKSDGIWYVEASRDNNYVDAGATCSDMVDGNISQDVEVSGDVVNMAAVGTYKINYNCEDSAGQVAHQATRTVVVQDTTCPTCLIPGTNDLITVEASFPYSEEASTCTDTLDGAMPSGVIEGHVDVESTGTYTLTYSATDKNGNVGGAIKADGTCTSIFKTVIVEDTMVPIISLKYRGNNLVGMMAESTTTTVNGWVVGAVASAVSGVALLGYAATRKATVATSVPV